MVFSYQHRGQTSGFPGRSIGVFRYSGTIDQTRRTNLPAQPWWVGFLSGRSEVSITAAFDEEGVWFAWGEGDRVDREFREEATTRSGGDGRTGRCCAGRLSVYRGLSWSIGLMAVDASRRTFLDRFRSGFGFCMAEMKSNNVFALENQILPTC